MRKTGSVFIRNALPLCAAAAAACLLLTHAPAAKKGASEALTLCATVMIPSLFPMLIVSGYAASCRCPAALQKLCARPLRALFGLSPGCLTPLLLGLTCGYPMAAKAAAAAKAEGLITGEDAERLTLFFTCPGVPFAVVAAGGWFRSRAVGWTLLASCVSADVLTALAYRLLPRQRKRATAILPEQDRAESPPDRLVRAVDGAVRAMLSICAWICAFSAFLSVCAAMTGERTGAAIALTAEVTAALRSAAAANDAPLAAACLAFGGVCVCCQLLPELTACGAGALRYAAVRLVCAAAAWAAETALLRLLSLPVPTGTRLGGFYLAADSAAGAAALFFLCAVFMAETSRRRAPK